LEGNEGNVREMWGSMKKMEICRKEPVMKMMVEHHFVGIPKFFSFLFNHLTFILNMKLFQNIVIPGYIEGLDYNSHIPRCTSVGPLLRKIIPTTRFL